MFNLLFVLLSLAGAMPANDLPTKKYLDLAAIKTMVAAAEAEAKKRNVGVTICIVDDSGNLLFLQKGDTASINTIEFAQKKARHAALYKGPSKDAADAVKKGSVEALAFPNFFRTRRTADYRGRPDSGRDSRKRSEVGDRRGHCASSDRCAAQEVGKRVTISVILGRSAHISCSIRLTLRSFGYPHRVASG